MSSNISWVELTQVKQLYEIQAQWEALSQTQIYLKPFNSIFWIFTWLKVFWQDHWQLKVLTAWEDNKLVAIVPLYLQQQTAFSLKTLHPLGQGEQEATEVSSEYLDILIQSKCQKNIKPKILQWIKNIKADQLVWQALLDESTANQLFQESGVRSNVSTATRYFVTKQSWSTDKLSKNMRSRYRRGLNQLITLDAKIGWVEKEQYDEYWQIMKKFHQQRWRNRNKKGAFESKEFNQFHSEFRKQVPNNVLMSAIWVSNEPIAVHYYFTDPLTLYFYQSGWNEDQYSNLSPGLLLHLWSIENMDKLYYDFMMGKKHDSYKAKFLTQQQPMYNIKVKFSPLKLMAVRITTKIKSFTN